MKWTIATIGKPRLDYAAAGVAEYLARLERFVPVEWIALKQGTPQTEGAALLERTAGAHRIVLDERGSSLTSRAFADYIARLEQSSTRRAAILIGGADGHAPATRDAADLVLSLSSLTLQHELALVVALEQIYRAYTILRGTPYHRD